MKFTELSLKEQICAGQDRELRDKYRYRITQDTEKLTQGSIVRISWADEGDDGAGIWISTSRHYGYYLEGDELEILEFADDHADLYTAKRVTPWPKPSNAMIPMTLWDSTGQEIQPGDYVIMSYNEQLLHCRYTKQISTTKFSFKYQNNKRSFNRQLSSTMDKAAGTANLPESLKIYTGTLDHLMMRKLQGLT